MALPGQWFIGIVDTATLQILLAPVNVFEGTAGKLNQDTLNNTNMRAINRYASGAPGARLGRMQDFATFAGHNWLASRPIGQTHHACTALHYQCDPDDCLGFTLIKLAPGFAQIKFASASMNTKPGYVVHHSFSRGTVSGHRYEPGTPQMPPHWAHALATYLRGAPFHIPHLAMSND